MQILPKLFEEILKKYPLKFESTSKKFKITFEDEKKYRKKYFLCIPIQSILDAARWYRRSAPTERWHRAVVIGGDGRMGW